MIGRPKFVTVDDYNNYWGEDLRGMLRDTANSSNKAEAHLARAEDRLMTWIDVNSFRRQRYDKLNDFQLEMWKKAIVTHAKYMFKQGDIANDSGYDMERGIIADAGDLNKITISQATLNYLIEAGLFSLVMKNRPRVNTDYATLGYDGYNQNS